MRSAFIVLLVVWLAQTGKAQDTIRRTDGVLIPAEILEIKSGEIFFKKTADPDKRVYIISTQEIEWVRYANGTQRSFMAPAEILPKKEPILSSFKRNIIALRPFDLLFPVLSFTYERLSPTQKFSYRIPVSFGLSANNLKDPYYAFFYSAGKSFSSGIELNFYIGNPDRFRYFIGPAFHFGFLRYTSEYYNTSGPNTHFLTKGTQFALLVNNGFWFQAIDKVVLGADVGLGFRRRSFKENTITPYNYYQTVRPKLSANVSIGITF
jgi:hypothetical protein